MDTNVGEAVIDSQVFQRVFFVLAIAFFSFLSILSPVYFVAIPFLSWVIPLRLLSSLFPSAWQALPSLTPSGSLFVRSSVVMRWVWFTLSAFVPHSSSLIGADGNMPRWRVISSKRRLSFNKIKRGWKK